MTDKKSELPYTMDDVKAVTEKLDMTNRNKASIVRQAVKILPMRISDISIATGMDRKYVTACIGDMVKSGFVRRLADRRIEYISSPSNNHKDRLRDVSMVGGKARPLSAWAGKEGETVEEFLARGGVIEKCETELKFERLTRDEIIAKTGRVTMGYQSPSSVKYSNSW